MRHWRWPSVSVILKEFHVDQPNAYFTDYVRRTTDFPMLVMLEQQGDKLVQAVSACLGSRRQAGSG